MSDFPRGWTLSANTTNPSTTSITVAAVAGVVHVLDGFNAILTAIAAAATGNAIAITLTSSDGVFAAFQLATVSLAGGAVGADSASGSGLDLAAGPGASLTIAYNAVTPANFAAFLLVQGHDI